MPQFAAQLEFETLDFGQDFAADAVREFLRVLIGGCHTLKLPHQVLNLSGELGIVAELHSQVAEVALSFPCDLVGYPAVMRISGRAVFAAGPAIATLIATILAARLLTALLVRLT